MKVALLFVLSFWLTFCFAVPLGAQTGCVAPPDDLISWWPADGNAEDLGVGNDGALQNGTSFDVGIVGQAFRFDGINDYVQVLTRTGLSPTVAVSVEAWVRTEGPISHAMYVYDRLETGDGFGLLLNSAGAPLLSINGGFGIATSSAQVDDGQWHHVAGTYSTGQAQLRIYVDGVLRGVRSYAARIDYRPQPRNQIGRARSGSGTRHFKGWIDELTIYARALTPQEILGIWAAGAAGKCKTGPNQLPVADAGLDQAVDEGDPVTLDRSESQDPDDDPLTYTWTQVAGPTVTLDVTIPVHPTFNAPLVAIGGEVLTFELVVGDGTGFSDPDPVDVMVRNVNTAPEAHAGDDQIVPEGTTVRLDGSSSFDPEGDDLTYLWVQDLGPPVILVDPTAPVTDFPAPSVGAAGATLEFTLTVSDGALMATDSISIQVDNVNRKPVADPGPPLVRDEATLVTLDGSASSDPDGDAIVSYAWLQTQGMAVVLSDPSSSTPSFTAPVVGPGGVTLVFSLVVSDGLNYSDPEPVTVTVLDSNDPPNCSTATATPALLWPPNHKMVKVTLGGLADPDADPITVTITDVMQDEPVDGLGVGDSGPDAVIQSSSVLLRAERQGNGNGRVYTIYFIATDSLGQSCSGSVTVTVPKSRKKNDAAVDDGQIYEST